MCFLMRLVSVRFHPELGPTLRVKFAMKTLNFESKVVKAQI
ncbi:unnamed protein product [Brassica oleracea var. botrytis]